MRSTVTLHVVSSLDGFIAKKDNSVSGMDSSGDVCERGVTDDGSEVIQSIGCYVLGSRTYEHALQLGWPYGDTPTVVITNRELPSTMDSVEFYYGDLKKRGRNRQLGRSLSFETRSQTTYREQPH